MESSARAGNESSGKKSRWLWWFLSGLVLGILATIFLPDLVRPYLPDMFKGENVEISGIVEAKSREADRLLLTIGGDAGAVLVTYTEEIPEMDLLIEPGDSVVLAVREYAPFVEDPSVRRVQKGATVRRSNPARMQNEAAPAEIERRPTPAQTEQQPAQPETDATRELDAPADSEFFREPGAKEDAADEPPDAPAAQDGDGAVAAQQEEGQDDPE
jgi:hypothetical protein